MPELMEILAVSGIEEPVAGSDCRIVLFALER